MYETLMRVPSNLQIAVNVQCRDRPGRVDDLHAHLSPKYVRHFNVH